jgi:AraC-like DNA-binding protein
MELFVARRESKEPSEISRIKKYIAENIPNVTLDGISKELGRSTSYISHVFKKNTGRSIRAYCNELKLFEAQKLLTSTDLSVTEIAFDAGFEDTAYFIRLFRETYGITPNKYRKV